jgi:hypothetical protein
MYRCTSRRLQTVADGHITRRLEAGVGIEPSQSRPLESSTCSRSTPFVAPFFTPSGASLTAATKLHRCISVEPTGGDASSAAIARFSYTSSCPRRRPRYTARRATEGPACSIALRCTWPPRTAAATARATRGVPRLRRRDSYLIRRQVPSVSNGAARKGGTWSPTMSGHYLLPQRNDLPSALGCD